FQLHHRLRQHARSLTQEVHILLQLRLAQQFVECHPEIVGHGVGPPSGFSTTHPMRTTPWPTSSTASSTTHFSGRYHSLARRSSSLAWIVRLSLCNVIPFPTHAFVNVGSRASAHS